MNKYLIPLFSLTLLFFSLPSFCQPQQQQTAPVAAFPILSDVTSIFPLNTGFTSNGAFEYDPGLSITPDQDIYTAGSDAPPFTIGSYPSNLDATGVADLPPTAQSYYSNYLTNFIYLGPFCYFTVNGCVPTSTYRLSFWVVGPRTYTLTLNNNVVAGPMDVPSGAIRQINVGLQPDMNGNIHVQLLASGGHTVNIYSYAVTTVGAPNCSLNKIAGATVSFTTPQDTNIVVNPDYQWVTLAKYPPTNWTIACQSPYGDFTYTVPYSSTQNSTTNAPWSDQYVPAADKTINSESPIPPTLGLVLNQCSSALLGLAGAQPSPLNYIASCTMQPGTYSIKISADSTVFYSGTAIVTPAPSGVCQVAVPCPTSLVCNGTPGTGSGGSGSSGCAVCSCLSGGVASGIQGIIPQLVSAIMDGLKQLLISLFVPSTSTIDQLLGTNGTYQSSFLHSFVTWGPVNVLTEVQQGIQNSQTADSSHAPAFKFDVITYKPFYETGGWFFGKNVDIGLAEASNYLKPGSYANPGSNTPLGQWTNADTPNLTYNYGSSAAPTSAATSYGNPVGATHDIRPLDVGNSGIPAIVYQGTIAANFNSITGSWSFQILRYLMGLSVYIGGIMFVFDKLVPKMEF